MNNIYLSIVIPSIPSRFDKACALFNKLQSQINQRLTKPSQVEIIMFTDNKQRSIGKKREECVRLAQGMYVAILDDDDDVSGEYIFLLHKAIASIEEIRDPKMPPPSVICFKSKVTDKFGSYIVDMDLTHKENEQPAKDQCDRYKDIKRTPWHVCAWLSEIAKSIPFPNVGYGEDWHWVKQLIEKAHAQVKIDEVLHYYNDNPAVSEAPTGSNEIWRNPNE